MRTSASSPASRQTSESRRAAEDTGVAAVAVVAPVVVDVEAVVVSFIYNIKFINMMDGHFSLMYVKWQKVQQRLKRKYEKTMINIKIRLKSRF